MNCLKSCLLEAHQFSRHRLSVRLISCVNTVMSVALVASRSMYFGLTIPVSGMCLSYYSYNLESKGIDSITPEAASKYIDMVSISLACVLGVMMLFKWQIIAGIFLLMIQSLNILIGKNLFSVIKKSNSVTKIGYKQQEVSVLFYILICCWMFIYAFVGVSCLAMRAFA